MSQEHVDKKQVRIQSRVDTAAQWTSNNPQLLNREIGYERETGKYKIGDGIHTWNDLPYAITSDLELGKDNITNFSSNTFASGANNIAGGKAFKIVAEPSGTDGGVGTYELNSVEDIEVGMTYSAVTTKAAYHQGTIENIDPSTNTVTVNNFKGYKLNTNIDDPDNFNVYNVFIIDGHPELGTVEIGFNAQAFGQNNIAHNVASHVEGKFNNAVGKYSHVEGLNNIAGHAAHAEGTNNLATGDAAHAEGEGNKAVGSHSHAEGYETSALAYTAHSEGLNTTANGNASHAEGTGTVASGYASHVEGEGAKASGYGSHAEGHGSEAKEEFAHAEGKYSYAEGKSSHAEGLLTKATGNAAHTEGQHTIATNKGSHAEGYGTEELKVESTGIGSHAEGVFTKAKANGSHAEGQQTEALGFCSHTEGEGTRAENQWTHAEGVRTHAYGNASHVEGYETYARGNVAHVEGWGTIANADIQHVQGKYNEPLGADYVHIVGNGTSDTDRKNSHTLDKDGNAWFAGNIKVGADSKELATKEDVDNAIVNQVGSFVYDSIGPRLSNVEEQSGLHRLSKDNPHNVTAEQVGTYTKEEVDNLLIEKANAINQLSEEKADKEFVVSIFEQLKALIEAGKTDEVIAVLDEAILDLAVLA